jgi:hypothetical protein
MTNSSSVRFVQKTLPGNTPVLGTMIIPSVASADKAYYQAFFRVLIDLIVELLGLIIKPFDNQTES